MKKVIFLISIASMFLSIGKTEAQLAQFSQYMFNGLYINPAYAGYKDVLYGHLLYRQQWTGEGSPRTAMFSVDAAMANRSNVGTSVIIKKLTNFISLISQIDSRVS